MAGPKTAALKEAGWTLWSPLSEDVTGVGVWLRQLAWERLRFPAELSKGGTSE